MLVTLILVFLAYISINIYVYIRSMHYSSRHKFFKHLIIFGHAISLLFLAGIIIFSGKPHHDYRSFSLYFHFNALFILILIPVINLFTFYLISDLVLLFIRQKIRHGSCIMIRRIFHKTAVGISLILWGLIFHGHFWGLTSFHVREYTIASSEIPESFVGVKIVHFSDTHLGSFFNTSSVEKGLRLIQDQNPDIIVFTGDLVNISAEEAEPYISLFSSLSAPLGKYAVLGNHDMSDYMKIDINRDSLNVNTPRVVEILGKMGFMVLRDTSIYVSNGTDSIQLAGTDNFGQPPFRRWGNLEKALKNAGSDRFLILLTHDPSAWDKIIADDLPVDLTLSGHTHGMQLGIRRKFLEWSPIQLKYPNWAGLYFNNKKMLHVNPGFGYIGLPFRIGVYPEITVLTLSN